MASRTKLNKIETRHAVLSYKNRLLSGVMHKNQLGANFQKFAIKFDEELGELLKLLEERCGNQKGEA